MIKNLLKRKKTLLFIFIVLTIIVLLVLNFSRLEKFQASRRNQDRKEQMDTILKNVESYLKNNNNNLPTTSNPAANSFLPELYFENNKPAGGVPVSTLENMNGYSMNIINDPSGTPYFIGTFESQIIVYTTSGELVDGTTIEYVAYKIETKNQQLQ